MWAGESQARISLHWFSVRQHGLGHGLAISSKLYEVVRWWITLRCSALCFIQYHLSIWTDVLGSQIRCSRSQKTVRAVWNSLFRSVFCAYGPNSECGGSFISTCISRIFCGCADSCYKCARIRTLSERWTRIWPIQPVCQCGVHVG